MVHRRGLGKVRSLDVAWLWVQEKAGRGLIAYSKAPRAENVADVFTKAASPAETKAALEELGLEVEAELDLEKYHHQHRHARPARGHSTRCNELSGLI